MSFMSLFGLSELPFSDHEVHHSIDFRHMFSCLDWKSGVVYVLEIFEVDGIIESYFRHASSSQRKTSFTINVKDFIERSEKNVFIYYDFLKTPFVPDSIPFPSPEFRLFCDSHIAAVWGCARDHFPELKKIRLPWEHEWEKLVVYLSLESNLSYPILLALSRPSSNYHIKKCISPIDDADESEESE